MLAWLTHNQRRSATVKHIISAIAAAVVIIPGLALNGIAGPARAAKQIAHLEWLPMVSGSACVISPSCPATENSIPVRRGIRLDSSSHTEIRLDGRFQDLYGTAYLDDDSATYASIYLDFVDTSDSAKRVTLLHIRVFRDRGVPFAFSVRGVRDLLIDPSGDNGHAMADIVASVATDAPAAQPATHPGAVTPRYPANGTPVPAGSRVLFTWKPYPGAAIYALHIWLTHRPGAKPLPAGVPVAASATASGHTSYTWNDRGFPSGTYQCAILPLDATGNAIGTWSQPVQFAIVG
jgi:hypothetical protein